MSDDQVIQAALAILAKRISKGPVLTSPNDVQNYLTIKMAGLEREEFGVIFLDSQNKVIGHATLFTGTLSQTAVYPREVVKAALLANAAGVIFAHNHPSGVCEPSVADRVLTDALKKALATVDIQTLDHFIVAADKCTSFVSRGWL